MENKDLLELIGLLHSFTPGQMAEFIENAKELVQAYNSFTPEQRAWFMQQISKKAANKAA